jgi:uncharacterized protein YukE
MNENNQTGSNTNPSDIGDEIRSLGKNLEQIFRTFWESDERRRIQKEVTDGMDEVGKNLRQAAAEFSQSETGQRMKSDFEDIHQRFESGEIQEKSRAEFLTALQKINQELERAAESLRNSSNSGGAPKGGEQ